MEKCSFDPLQLQNLGAALLAWGATCLIKDHSKKTPLAGAGSLSSYTSPSTFRYHWTIQLDLREKCLSQTPDLTSFGQPAARCWAGQSPGWAPVCSSEQLSFWAAGGCSTGSQSSQACPWSPPMHSTLCPLFPKASGSSPELCHAPGGITGNTPGALAKGSAGTPGLPEQPQISETQQEEIPQEEDRSEITTCDGTQGTGGKGQVEEQQGKCADNLCKCFTCTVHELWHSMSVLRSPQTIKPRFIRSGLKTYCWVRAGSSLMNVKSLRHLLTSILETEYSILQLFSSPQTWVAIFKI